MNVGLQPFEHTELHVRCARRWSCKNSLRNRNVFAKLLWLKYWVGAGASVCLFQVLQFEYKTVLNGFGTDLTEKSQWRPITIPRDFSLYGAIETIARTPDSHRLAIIHPKDHSVVGVVTESMIIGWLYVNLDKFGQTKKLQCSEITRSYFVASIEESELAVRNGGRHTSSFQADTHSHLLFAGFVQIKAFKIMAERKLSGLAVVNKMGLLVDTISVRDLKGIGPDAELFTRLWDTVSVAPGLFARAIRIACN